MSDVESDPQHRQPDQQPDQQPEQQSVLANSAVMAAGTVVSRFSGFIRSTLLAAALGVGFHADLFTIANTVPNMLYILLAGGIFNAVLVPQLVRSMKLDDDGGAGYVDRVMTLAICFLGLVSILLVIAAPLVMDLMLSNQCTASGGAARESAIDLARYCLPQVFFYGMFVLVGQILNARGTFGPMMWAPIANNILSIAVLIAYLIGFGPATTAEQNGPFTPGQEALLGIGATTGIALQFLILVPYLRAAGIRYRPRFDFRGVGLGHTFHLAVWTVLFVIVNQIAYVVVVRLASSGTACASDGTGITIYSNVMLVTMVPHSIITVSLATAILPRMSAFAAENDLAALGRTLSRTLRTALVVVVPFAFLLPVIALPLADLLWGHGATAGLAYRFRAPLVLFGFAMVAFTVHYLTLRGFYALERNRLVFFIQCLIAGTNIGLAILFVSRVDPWDTAPMLVLAYGSAYTIGATVSTIILRRLLRRSDDADGSRTGPSERWPGFVVRLGLAGLVVWTISGLLDIVVGDTIAELVADPGWVLGTVRLGIVTAGTVGVFLAAAAPLRLTEVTSILTMLLGRVRRR